ncbi:aldose epimerase family protein [Marinobacter alexandrii]|uniref:aldose epimerase family protein n=1 Tax=Marinobacter alexandrii TaxID=2570351 RepID=UPI003264BD11
MASKPELFDHLDNGEPVLRHWLEAGQLRVAILNFGATLQDLRLAGIAHPLVLGARNVAAYRQAAQYFGATVGRVANRIAQGRATLDGRQYRLCRDSEQTHMLHGGPDGTHNQLWTIADADRDQITLKLSLPDGHMGFPGLLDIRLTYRLIAPATLEMCIEARADATTLCNFAHHSYFNLDGTPSVLDHRLQIAAEHYLPTDGALIPTGEVARVSGTRFDFRQTRPIRCDGENKSYDLNFCLDSFAGLHEPIATLHGPQSGIRMQMYSSEPGLQIYDGQHITVPADQTLSGIAYVPFAGIALEAQKWPDAVHHPAFPSIRLEPGQVYRQTTRWCFLRD